MAEPQAGDTEQNNDIRIQSVDEQAIKRDDVKDRVPSEPIYGYFLFLVLSIGAMASPFIFILSLDFYHIVFVDFTQIAYLINFGFSVGGWVTVVFFLLPLLRTVPIPILLPIIFMFNFFIIVTATVLNWACTLPSVLTKGTSAHWAVMSLLIILNVFAGASSGINWSGIAAIAGPISPRYMSAAMAGSASASFMVSILRIIAKGIGSAIGDTLYIQMVATNVFFAIAAFLQLICIALSISMIVLPITRDVLKKKRKELEDARTEPENIETIENIELKSINALNTEETKTVKKRFLEFLSEWLSALQIIWLPGVCTLFTFFVSYSLYPGVVTDFISNMSTYFQSSGWFTVSILATYSLFDFIGRTLSVFRRLHFIGYRWLWTVLLLRLAFYPAFILFVRFNKSVYDPFKYIAVVLLGLTNGYFCTVSMMQGSALSKKKLAGHVLSVLLYTGILLGSAFGILLGYLVGLMPQT